MRKIELADPRQKPANQLIDLAVALPSPETRRQSPARLATGPSLECKRFKMRTTGSSFAEALGVGAVAGVVGGLGEIAWIALYGAATGAQTGPVARGIVSSVIPGLAASSWSPWLGILIHLGLAIALGLSLALMVRPLARRGGARHFEFWPGDVCTCRRVGREFLCRPAPDQPGLHSSSSIRRDAAIEAAVRAVGRDGLPRLPHAPTASTSWRIARRHER